MSRKERERRKSTARRRAEEKTSGFSTTTLNLPEGMSFFEFKPGVHTVDVIPYTVKKGKHTPGGNPYAEEGELHYERTYYMYRSVGPEEKPYVCLAKTFGKPDPIQ